ncbi:MAG: transposase family protein [Actinomyces sp.]|uniref:transposase family protein n=1 Tax=Actinomyces sp. TaxID=29317 RepID=UPI0026DC9E8E|nr:transposase family protein [Actinomyces sp.]MDO4242804.1 transposase family protein [Actinomyces sp.]
MHKAFGGNVQVLTDHTGLPVWVWPVAPGSTHDITAARAHVLPALYKAAADGMPTLADTGYTGSGAGVLTPVKGTRPCPDDATFNHLHTALRAPAARANAMLKHFKALRHVSLDPLTITTITAAVLAIMLGAARSAAPGRTVSPPNARPASWNPTLPTPWCETKLPGH